MTIGRQGRRLISSVCTLRSADLRREKDLEASVVCSLSIEATPRRRFQQIARAQRKPFMSGNRDVRDSQSPGAFPQVAADRVLAVVDARVPNVEWWNYLPLKAEQISFGQNPSFA